MSAFSDVRRVGLFALLTFGPAGAIASACGGTTTEVIYVDGGHGTITPGGGVDASGLDAGSDTGSQIGIYPAAHPAIPLVGTYAPTGVAHIMQSQKIVTVVFPGDALQPRLEAFTDFIGTSDWWKATTTEYCTSPGGSTCIGPSSVLQHVTLTDPAPATISSAGVETYIQGLIDQGLVPPPAADVIYTLFFPSTTQIGDPGFMSCSYFDGYHSSFKATPPPVTDDDGGVDGGTTTGTALEVEYAVLARCTPDEGETTLATAHELIEAATDPDGYGYNIMDPAWAGFFYSEVGDLCDYEPAQYIGSQFVVESGWSNLSAKAGHNPCVPGVAGEVYYNAAPAQSQISLAVGDTTTIDVMPFSEGPTDDWQIQAVDYTAETGQPALLDLSIDHETVNNGVPVKLTIKLLAQPPNDPQTGQVGAIFAIISRKGQTEHAWPGLVTAK